MGSPPPNRRPYRQCQKREPKLADAVARPDASPLPPTPTALPSRASDPHTQVAFVLGVWRTQDGFPGRPTRIVFNAV